MKIGAVLTIFDSRWQQTFQPLLEQDFDFFELLPENPDVYKINDLQHYFHNRELILHAPFIQANLISHDLIFRHAAQHYLIKELSPLVEMFHPKVITTHLGSTPFIYREVNLDGFSQLKKIIPACVVENMPGGKDLWRKSYPSTEEELDWVLERLDTQITFDVGHFMKQGFDVYILLKKYLPRIVNIHLHDIANGQDHRPLGSGELDLGKFLAILKDSHYKNYLSIELHHDNVTRIIESYQLLKRFIR